MQARSALNENCFESFDTGGDNLFFKKLKMKKALKNYNKSVRYLPYETSPLLLRGLRKCELGDQDGNCINWNRINKIRKIDVSESSCPLS